MDRPPAGAGHGFRLARREDLTAIVRMLADDTLGATREAFREPLPEPYVRAFAEIDADPNNELIVAERDGAPVGVLQITYAPNLTYEGGRRATIEGVRVARDARGGGLGAALIEHAVERARARGCRIVQLTTNRERSDAIRFYERLGFSGTHVGMKRFLT